MGRLHEAAAQARSLRATEHRPYPLLKRPWAMGQAWQNLLFAHWRVPCDLLRPHCATGQGVQLPPSVRPASASVD